MACGVVSAAPNQRNVDVAKTMPRRHAKAQRALVRRRPECDVDAANCGGVSWITTKPRIIRECDDPDNQRRSWAMRNQLHLTDENGVLVLQTDPGYSGALRNLERLAAGVVVASLIAWVVQVLFPPLGDKFGLGFFWTAGLACLCWIFIPRPLCRSAQFDLTRRTLRLTDTRVPERWAKPIPFDDIASIGIVTSMVAEDEYGERLRPRYAIEIRPRSDAAIVLAIELKDWKPNDLRLSHICRRSGIARLDATETDVAQIELRSQSA